MPEGKSMIRKIIKMDEEKCNVSGNNVGLAKEAEDNCPVSVITVE